MWDSQAVLLATKAIGVVESDLKYNAVNPSDPITVGIFQWYGVRAAAILNRMKVENGSSWTGVAASLDNDLTNVGASDVFWNTRYLNGSEIASIRPVLLANVAIQDNQASTDIALYLTYATNYGMDKDSNTDAVIFFMVMWHQRPVSALNILRSAGPASTMDRLYAYCLNDSILGAYRTRYTAARNIIASHDTSGVGEGGSQTTYPGGNSGSVRPETAIRRIALDGDGLRVFFKDGHSVQCVPGTAQSWIPRKDSTLGADTDGDPGGGTHQQDPPSVQQSALVAFMAAHSDAYAYSQGPGRLTPTTSGYTDCSGICHEAYKVVCGLDVGGWTGEQIGRGSLVTTSKEVALAETELELGDLIFFRWSSNSPSTYDHVEMYAGSGHTWSHGGPDNGPDYVSLSGEVNSAATIMVRRYVN